MVNVNSGGAGVKSEQPKLPDQIAETLRQLLSDQDNHQWLIGDYLVDVVDELGPAYSLPGFRAWCIRELAKSTGADASTLRDRECMARFYPAPVRERYEALTYHQLRACKSAGDDWQRFADWAMEHHPAPVSLIRAMVKNGGVELPEAWRGRWERLLIPAGAIADDEKAPPELRGLCAGLGKYVLPDVPV